MKNQNKIEKREMSGLRMNLKTMTSFQCEAPTACGRGTICDSICDSCWAKGVAEHFLPIVDKWMDQRP